MSLVYPVHRYRCDGAECRWEGLLARPHRRWQRWGVELSVGWLVAVVAFYWAYAEQYFPSVKQIPAVAVSAAYRERAAQLIKAMPADARSATFGCVECARKETMMPNGFALDLPENLSEEDVELHRDAYTGLLVAAAREAVDESLKTAMMVALIPCALIGLTCWLIASVSRRRLTNNARRANTPA